jgi:hypothetical protein
MWLWYCIPAAASLPLNLLILCAKFLSPNKKTRSSIKMAVVGAAIASIAYCACDAIPSLALFTDVFCEDEPKGTNQAELKESSISVCIISRMSIHLLQIVMYLCGVMSLDVYLAIVRNLEQKKRRIMVNMAFVVAVVVPLLCLAACYALDDDDDFFNPKHLSRQTFTCEPRLESTALEWLFIHVHFVLGALLTVATNVVTIRALFVATGKASGQISSGRISTSSMKKIEEKSQKAWKGIGQRIIAKLQKTCTLRLVVMAAMTSFILLTYTIVNVFTSSTLDEYANGLDESFSKAVLGGTVETPDGRPSVAVQSILYCSLACVPFLNGAVFAKPKYLMEMLGLGEDNKVRSSIVSSSHSTDDDEDRYGTVKIAPPSSSRKSSSR